MKRGRPSDPDAHLRTRIVRFACTPEEEVEIDARASTAGLTRSAWVRERLLGDAVDARAPTAPARSQG